MRWKLRFLLPMLCLLTACSFQPLYGERSGVTIFDVSDVAIAEPADRFSQLVRNNLVGAGDDNGSPSQPFTMELTFSTSNSAVVRSKKGVNERELLQASVGFRLFDVSDGRLLLEGQAFANIPHDRVDSEFANLQASSDAGQRAARQVADDIRTRLAVFFATRYKAP